jgi:hypothetical protein
MPLYNTATVATALGTSLKWLDNLLSHNKIDGVMSGRQGVRRRLSTDAVRTVALARELIDHVGLPAPAAVKLAESVLSSQAGAIGGGVRRQLSPALAVEVDLTALDREVRAGLAHAVEVTPHPVRGRPRSRHP